MKKINVALPLFPASNFPSIISYEDVVPKITATSETALLV